MGNPWVGKRMGAAAVILNAWKQVLLVKHSYGRFNWELPGGAVEAGESVADAAVREVREETGLSVKAERMIGTYHAAENDSHHFVFLCTLTCEGQNPISASHETTDCGYFSPDSLPRPISDFTVRRIQDALSLQTLALPISVGPRQWLE